MTKSALTVLALAVLHSATAGAQWWRDIDQRAVSRGDRFLGASAAASFYMAGGAHFADISERNAFAAAVRAEWVLESIGPFAVSSTVELVPLTIVSRRAGPLRDCWRTSDGGTRCQAAQTDPIFGSGLMPFGLKLYIANTRHARVFGAAATGLMAFDHDMPIMGARRLNFAVEYGAGVEVNAPLRTSVVLGWRFQHMSNAYTAPVNPGLDVNMLHVGLMRRRR